MEQRVERTYKNLRRLFHRRSINDLLQLNLSEYLRFNSQFTDAFPSDPPNNDGKKKIEKTNQSSMRSDHLDRDGENCRVFRCSLIKFEKTTD